MRVSKIILAMAMLLGVGSGLRAQTTAFTYQGRLNNNGGAANGVFDFQFSLLDAATNGTVIAGPITNAATLVSNGMFTVKLDFGARAFNGSPRWLQIGVRSNGSTNAFSLLKPRQPVAAIFRNPESHFSWAANFPIGRGLDFAQPADLEIDDTADLETRATPPRSVSS